jgi:hypothetical protein
MSILAADGGWFLDWQDVVDAVEREPWCACWIDRPGHLPVTVHTRDSGLLVVSDGELLPAERAGLCAMRFCTHRLSTGTFWSWLPPSGLRRPRPGREQLLRNIEITRARLRERNRKTPRVLRDVFHATPDQLTLVLEPDDLEDEADVAL